MSIRRKNVTSGIAGLYPLFSNIIFPYSLLRTFLIFGVNFPLSLLGPLRSFSVPIIFPFQIKPQNMVLLSCNLTRPNNVNEWFWKCIRVCLHYANNMSELTISHLTVPLWDVCFMRSFEMWFFTTNSTIDSNFIRSCRVVRTTLYYLICIVY